MHKLFVSEGVVLNKRGVGEASTRVSILTKDLGLITASAKSARVETSKLRYGLELLTCGTFSVVRGRYEWKLVGVENVSRKFISPHSTRRSAVGRLVKLLLRLVQGEEPAENVYTTVVEGFGLLVDARTQEEADAIEIVFVLRILSRLGYLPHTETLSQFVDNDFSLELSANALKSRGLLIKTINESLQSSGL